MKASFFLQYFEFFFSLLLNNMEDPEDEKTEKFNLCDAEINIMDDGERIQRVAEVLSENQFQPIEDSGKSMPSSEEVIFYCGENSPDDIKGKYISCKIKGTLPSSDALYYIIY